MQSTVVTTMASVFDPTPLQRLKNLPPRSRLLVLARYEKRFAARLGKAWRAVARKEQRPPKGDWRVWLIMAGRGFGKTRAGAEWVDAFARRNPGARIALVGATTDDVRSVMIEGEAGILACARGRRVPLWSPSLKRLIWPGGAMATCYSAADPEGLRGPSHHIAWADEVARWDAGGGYEGGGGRMRSRGQAAWDNLMMGMRLGDCPQVCATTTPRAVPLMRAIRGLDGVVETGGSTLANAANLSSDFVATMRNLYGDTMIGRQEIGGELIEDVPGALWTRVLLEGCRASFPPSAGGLSRSQTNAAGAYDGSGSLDGRVSTSLDAARDERGLSEYSRVLIGVDPPASSEGDACGIVVVASLAAPLEDGTEFVVLADASVERASPERWARAVAEAGSRWGADRIVAEANNGGDMVRRVLEAEDRNLAVTLVRAVRGKSERAEPVAHAYLRGRVKHAGVFTALEDQLCGMQIGGGYAGPGRSPDRADACVWAISELMRGAGATGPRVRML